MPPKKQATLEELVSKSRSAKSAKTKEAGPEQAEADTLSTAPAPAPAQRMSARETKRTSADPLAFDLSAKGSTDSLIKNLEVRKDNGRIDFIVMKTIINVCLYMLI
jgi:hypothetical protein